MIIYAVHGTWPYGPPTWRGRRRERSDWKGVERPWFEIGSAFATAVTGDHTITWSPFTWSGDNTFQARQEAIDALKTRLCESLEASDEPHAIVAHSHGGAVALAAVAGLEARLQARVAGIVTMGTPFATLQYATSSSLGLAQGLLESAGAILPIALAVGVAIGWAVGAERLLFHALLSSAVVWLVSLILLIWILPTLLERRSRRRTHTFRDFGDAAKVKTPLVILRASGDEATLAIASAQAVQLAARALFQAFPISITDNRIRVRAWLPRACRVYLVLSFAGALVHSTLRNWDAVSGVVRFDRASSAAVSVTLAVALSDAAVSLVLFLVFGLAVSTALLACLAIASARALARATGPESRDLIAQVECEPVPSGVRAVLETLALQNAEEVHLSTRGLLRHSFHELPTARARVARAIEDWLTPAGDEVRALQEGGRARRLVLDRWVEAHKDVVRAGGPNARRQVQDLVDRALAADGPVTAFQLLYLLRPLLPEADSLSLDSVAIDLRLAETQAGLADVQRELEQM
ncbi:MAG: hypothetical protein ABI051_07255 [Vicinamibacterales bacterium]